MVSQKQLMLDVVHGRPTARIPWIPRLDLWYRAHQRAGTLPANRVWNSGFNRVDRGLGGLALHCLGDVPANSCARISNFDGVHMAPFRCCLIPSLEGRM